MNNIRKQAEALRKDPPAHTWDRLEVLLENKELKHTSVWRHWIVGLAACFLAVLMVTYSSQEQSDQNILGRSTYAVNSLPLDGEHALSMYDTQRIKDFYNRLSSTTKQ